MFSNVGHQKAHSFEDFFPFAHIRRRMRVITMEEFLKKEAVAGRLFKVPHNTYLRDIAREAMQSNKKKNGKNNKGNDAATSDAGQMLPDPANEAERFQVMYPPQNKTSFEGMIREERWLMWDYLRNVSACPAWQTMSEFLIIPREPSKKLRDTSRPQTAGESTLILSCI